MNNQNPLFDVKKGADDFRMIDCEVRNSSGRPIMKSAAKNTQVIRLKLFNTEIINTEIKITTLKKLRKWGIGGFISTIIGGLILLFVEYAFFK